MDELQEVLQRVAKIEAQVETNLASRYWVREAVDGAVKPLADSMQSLQRNMDKMSGSMDDMAKKFVEVFETQKQLMRDRGEMEAEKWRVASEQQAERHRAEMERLTAEKVALEKAGLLNFIQEKGTPTLAFLGSLIALLAAIGTYVGWMLTNYFHVATR